MLHSSACYTLHNSPQQSTTVHNNTPDQSVPGDSVYPFPCPPDQLKCSRFRRHTVHLEKKVEVISAEGYLFQWPRRLFQISPCIVCQATAPTPPLHTPTPPLHAHTGEEERKDPAHTMEGRCPRFSRHAVHLEKKLKLFLQRCAFSSGQGISSR